MNYVQKIKKMSSFFGNICAAQNIGSMECLPEKLILVPLLRCNYNCITCSQDHTDKRELPEACLTKIEAVLPFVKMVNITGGEPLMYGHLTRLLDQLGRYEVDIMLGTNGSLLTEKRREEIVANRVRWLKISVDGGTAKDYNRIRSIGNFNKVMLNVAKVSALSLKHKTSWPEIQFNFVALRSNIKSLKNLVTMAAEVGCSQINVIYCVCWNDALAKDSLYFCQNFSDEQMLLAAEMGKRLGVHVAIPKLFAECNRSKQEKNWLNTERCTEPFKNLSVTVEGKSGICCGYNGRHGDLKTQSFEEVWNHPTWMHIRQTVNTANESIICRNCTANKQDSTNIVSHMPNKTIRESAMIYHRLPLHQAI